MAKVKENPLQIPLNLGYERQVSPDLQNENASVFEVPKGTIIYPTKFNKGTSGFEVAVGFRAREIQSTTGKMSRRIYRAMEDALLIWNKSAKKVIILEGKFTLEYNFEFYYNRQEQTPENVASSGS